MKRALSRGEWLLIGAPLIGFGAFAALWARWKAISPATLTPSSVPLFTVYPLPNGRSVVGWGHQLDARNMPLSGTSWQLTRWDARTGEGALALSENRSFSSWTVSRDGTHVALYFPGKYNRTTQKIGPGTLVVRAMSGEEMGSWSVANGGYSRPLAFSPDARELFVLGQTVERFSVPTGKSLAVPPVPSFFSPKSSIKRMYFSPDKRMVALLEDDVSTSDDTTILPPSDATYARGGGRVAICEFPSLRLIARVKGDLFADCGWDSNASLWAVAPLMSGYTPQKLIRARFDVKDGTTHSEILALPSETTGWRPDTLFINGPTKQVVLASETQLVVWGSDGRQETSFGIHRRDLTANAYDDPTNNAVPRFSADGRCIYRINGTDVERYDLSRFLSGAAPTQTSGS